MTNRSGSLVGLASVVIIAASAPANAYNQYSVARDNTNCRACHGDFRSPAYVSLADGTNWGDLHDLHRLTMLNGDCSVCHGSGPRFPVLLSSSAGGDGLDAISCVGCHGRAEDNVAANPDFGSFGGSGAGLRQHHVDANVTVCATCHADALAANFSTVGEDVLPPYYANPGIGHPSIPDSACNMGGSEDFAGATVGLDNDGDGVYDSLDLDCSSPPPDAGIPDAGIADAAGFDAAVSDAGISDAAVVDAMGTDADVVDAGIVDAAAFDAVVADAGTEVVDGSAADADDFGSDAGGANDGASDGCGCQSSSHGLPSTSLFLLFAVAFLLNSRRGPLGRSKSDLRCEGRHERRTTGPDQLD